MPHRFPFTGCRSAQPPGIPDQRRTRTLPRDRARLELRCELSAMRGASMKKRYRFFPVMGILLMFASHAKAQEDADRIPITLGDFALSGSATGGYRFEDVKGYQPQFREMFALGEGFRLFDLNLYAESREGRNPFADTFSLQTTSLGGDPFPTAQFAISKRKIYDLRVDWRQSYFYWNQNDN